MNWRVLLTAGLVVSLTSELSAQAAVLRPDPELSPEFKVVETAIYRLRDSLNLVEAAGARIALDRAGTSDAVLRSRARLVADRCRGSIVASDSARTTLMRGNIPSPDPRGLVKRFDKNLDVVRTKLVWCEGEFSRLAKPENAEELRGYGIGRVQQVNEVVRLFQTEASIYLRNALGARYKPNLTGAGASGAPRTH